MSHARGPDPRLRVLYLLAVAIGVFLLGKLWQQGAVLGSQTLLWLAVGLGARRLGRQIVKLGVLSLFIVGSYAVFANDPATDQWTSITILGFALPFNSAGALEGITMVMRIWSVVMASQIARAGDPRAVSAGLAKLRVPQVMALSLDVVLALLGDGPERKGRGGGGGGGGGRGRGGGKGTGGAHAPDEPFMQSMKRLMRGDVAPIIDKIERQIARADAHALASDTSMTVALRRDVSVIAGIALTMLAIKMLKLLPSLPFAPGHKLILLTPLYIVAALLTRSRFGATLTGLVMGFAAFLLGDGRYGVFELGKHVAPGLVCDALLPIVMRGGRMPGAFAWSLVGAVIGMARFATIFLVTLSVQPPAVAFAFLLPGVVLNVFFGLMSGWVSYHVVRAALKLRDRLHRSQEEADEQVDSGRRSNPHHVEPDEGVAARSRRAQEDAYRR